MTVKMLELTCPCGKLFHVPKWRTGQTGICTTCKQEIIIPSVYDPEFWEEQRGRFQEDLLEDGATAAISEAQQPECVAAASQEVLDSSSQAAYLDTEAGAIIAPARRIPWRGLLLKLFLAILTLSLGTAAGIICGPTYLGLVGDNLISRQRFSQWKQMIGLERKNSDSGNDMIATQVYRRLAPLDQQKIPGDWYPPLLTTTQNIKQAILRQNYPAANKSYSRAIHSISRLTERIEQYRPEIERLYARIYQTESSGKNCHRWIVRERRRAKSVKRYRSLLHFEKFTQKGSIELSGKDVTQKLAQLVEKLCQPGYRELYAIIRELVALNSELREKKKEMWEMVVEFSKS